jgi:hypothetical protein
MRKPRMDAASAVFFTAVFLAACGTAAYLLIDLAVRAAD